jgi:hypothetical protein
MRLTAWINVKILQWEAPGISGSGPATIAAVSPAPTKFGFYNMKAIQDPPIAKHQSVPSQFPSENFFQNCSFLQSLGDGAELKSK